MHTTRPNPFSEKGQTKKQCSQNAHSISPKIYGQVEKQKQENELNTSNLKTYTPSSKSWELPGEGGSMRTSFVGCNMHKPISYGSDKETLHSKHNKACPSLKLKVITPEMLRKQNKHKATNLKPIHQTLFAKPSLLFFNDQSQVKHALRGNHCSGNTFTRPLTLRSLNGRNPPLYKWNNFEKWEERYVFLQKKMGTRLYYISNFYLERIENKC